MLFIHFVRYGPRLAYLLTVASLLALPGRAQNQTVRVIAFAAHPDVCDLGAGGIAAKYAARGEKVEFVSLTNGYAGHQSLRGEELAKYAGHQSLRGEELAKRRRAEALEAGRRIGIAYEVLANHDGKL